MTSTPPEILLTGAYPAWDMEPLAASYRLHRLWEATDRAALLAEHGGHIRAIATRGDLGASAELIAALPKLELIACYGVGTDAIDVAAAKARGIAVTNTPDVLTGDVADLAVGLALSLLRRIPAGDALVRAGTWPTRGLDLTTRLHGKRAGIVGLGRIGGAVARRLAAFDMPVGYFSRRPVAGSGYTHFGGVAELAAWCDVLVVTLAGGPETLAMVDAGVLAALGPAGWLVNVSRGSTVDEAALLDALENKAIAGAGLDVFLNEPRIDPRFFTLQNVVLQPHSASGTTETRRAMGQLVRDNLAAHFSGAPLLTPLY